MGIRGGEGGREVVGISSVQKSSVASRRKGVRIRMRLEREIDKSKAGVERHVFRPVYLLCVRSQIDYFMSRKGVGTGRGRGVGRGGGRIRNQDSAAGMGNQIDREIIFTVSEMEIYLRNRKECGTNVCSIEKKGMLRRLFNRSPFFLSCIYMVCFLVCSLKSVFSVFRPHSLAVKRPPAFLPCLFFSSSPQKIYTPHDDPTHQ